MNLVNLQRPIALLLVGTLALSPSIAAAQPAPAPAPAPLAESLPAGARADYLYGRTLFANNDFAGALAKFQQAYSASNDPRLLFNMALCERNLHGYARARELLQRYEHDAAARLSADEHAQVDAALTALGELVGTVHVAASESGAAVAVDGRVVGTTPLEPFYVDLGTHKLTVAKEGFDPVEQVLDVAGGADRTVTVTLLPRAHVAELLVKTNEDAMVSIDGRAAGLGSFEGKVPPGPHDLRISASGRKPYEARLVLRDGETRTVEASLEPEAHAAIWWPWVVGGAAVAAGLAVGGYFLFRSQPSTEPPLSGQLGSVTLATGGVLR
jgi:hypothetical protein